MSSASCSRSGPAGAAGRVRRPRRSYPPTPMLFDLQGKRRRVVQATYLTLAVLMGGGLVLFGIGGDVQGGLFDAFSDRSDTGNGNPIVEQRLKSAEERLRANPNDQQAL